MELDLGGGGALGSENVWLLGEDWITGLVLFWLSAFKLMGDSFDTIFSLRDGHTHHTIILTFTPTSLTNVLD